MKIQAILVAAGRGLRLKASVPKALIALNKKLLFTYSLDTFLKCPLIDSVIVVVPIKGIRRFQQVIDRKKYPKPVFLVEGGLRRRDSVKKGLENLDGDTDWVAIHDAARPFVNLKIIKNTIEAAQATGAAIAAVAVKSTIKEVYSTGDVVKKTLERTWLWEIQTPQVFKRDIILKAHQYQRLFDATDDAILVEKLGLKVKIAKGDENNIKITTPTDLMLAQAMIACDKSFGKE